MRGAAVYSPGYQLPLWLGSGQLRLWRRVDRLLGGRADAVATVRAIAAATGANPGVVSRDLGRLAALGFIVRSTRRGRLGNVRLWRVVSRRLRGLNARRRTRALSRLRVGPAQLSLAIDPVEPPGWWDAPRCDTCDRPRPTLYGEVLGPCPHRDGWAPGEITEVFGK